MTWWLPAPEGRASDENIDSLAEKANLMELMDREVNYGFSGGEIKRSELLQLLAQDPDLALLDEPESGVDLVNIALIGQLINELLRKEHPIRDRRHAGLIITHTGHILDYVNARTGYVLLDGRIVCEGDPHEILETIKSKGYRECWKMRELKSEKASEDKARAAVSKPAAFGEDIDLDKYAHSADELPYQDDPSKLPAETREANDAGWGYVG